MLSNLNDDCLLQIFQLLPLRDQVEITDVCEHFKYLIVNYIWSKKYTDVSTEMRCLEALSLRQYMSFFRANKGNIRVLQIMRDINNFVYVYNPKRVIQRPDCEFYLFLKMPNLRKIVCPHIRVHDSYIKMLTENCPKLEYISFGEGPAFKINESRLQIL